MKKLCSTLIILCITLCLSGCLEKEATFELAATELSDKETQLLDLVANNNYKVYDYVVDDQLRSVTFKTYELNKDLKWVEEKEV